MPRWPTLSTKDNLRRSYENARDEAAGWQAPLVVTEYGARCDGHDVPLTGDEPMRVACGGAGHHTLDVAYAPRSP